MANNHSHQLKTKPRNPCFLGCFGFSRRDKKVPVNLSVKAVESYSNNTIARSKKLESSGANLFSWSRFRMKNVSAVKTVPIPVVTAEIHSSKSKSKSKSKRRFLMIFTKRQHHHPKSTTSKTMSFHEIPAAAKVAKDDAPKEISQLEETPEQNIILQKRRSLDHVDSSKGDKCQRRSSFRRKIDAIRIGSSQPGSPDVIVTTKANPARTASMLSYSVSLPAPTRGKRANPSSHKLDPVVGMSIVMVTLIIMLIWGRLCAILCTSAWCYFVPRLLASSKTKDVMMGINGDPDINSEEHKKRVVLEGFLERDHRVVL